MKVLSAKQIREVDRQTIEGEPIASIDLMERACRAFVNWLITEFPDAEKIGIVCGTGNNGGDGLGIGRLLLERGYSVSVWVVRGGVESEDFKINYERIKKRTAVIDVNISSPVPRFDDCEILLDAIFGSGLSRPVEGIYETVISSMNAAAVIRIAVDIPSGMLADNHSSGVIVQADYTATFQMPKLAFFLPQSYQYTGEWHILDIGLKKDAIKAAETDHYYITEKEACKLLRPRRRFDHKGTFGHALLIAGSFGKMGAAVLSSRAVLRTGAGLLTVQAPGAGYGILQTSVPEAMVIADRSQTHISEIPDVEKYNAIGIGPGLGTDAETVRAVKTLLANFRKPIVFDADALNVLSANQDLFDQLPEGSILTPHPKEFERLVGSWENDFERLKKQKAFASRYRVVVLLKGSYTSIAIPDGKVYFNSTGNPALATGGTGDVLTGVVTSLLTQSYPPEEAAILGTFLHGMAGDLCSIDLGDRGILASDLIEYLPQAYKKLRRR